MAAQSIAAILAEGIPMPTKDPVPADSSEGLFRHRNGIPAVAVVSVCAVMYLVDMSVLASVPETDISFAANFAVPFDLMVCVPLVFYVLFVRRRGITPIAVLPVIYAGGAVSAAVAIPNAPSLLPVLLASAFVVDIAVLAREVPRLAKMFRKGYLARKEESAQPIEWYLGGFKEVVPSKAAARAAAMETAMWYWLAASWRQTTETPKGCTPFTYHKECGLVALSCAIVALGLTETVVVHLAVSRISAPAAFALSALSLYTLAWIAANARAAAKSPILVREDSVTAVWGAFFCVHVEGGRIERATLTDPRLHKNEVLDMSSLGGSPCWVILREPMEAETFLGTERRVKAIKLSPDRLQEFMECVNKIAAAKRQTAQDSQVRHATRCIHYTSNQIENA